MNIWLKIIYTTLVLAIVISNANGGGEVKEEPEITEAVALKVAKCGKEICKALSDIHYVDFYRYSLKFHQIKEHLGPYYHRQSKLLEKCNKYNCNCLTYCSLSCSKVDSVIKRIDSHIGHLKVYLQGLEEVQKFINQPISLTDSTDNTQLIGTALAYDDIESTAKNYSISQLEAASYLTQSTKNQIKEKENFVTYYLKKRQSRVVNYIRNKKFMGRLYSSLRNKYPQYFYRSKDKTYKPIKNLQETIENIFPE